MSTDGIRMPACAVVAWFLMLSSACGEEPGALVPIAHQVVVAERAIVASFDPDIEFARAIAMDGDVAVVGAPR